MLAYISFLAFFGICFLVGCVIIYFFSEESMDWAQSEIIMADTTLTQTTNKPFQFSTDQELVNQIRAVLFYNDMYNKKHVLEYRKVLEEQKKEISFFSVAKKWSVEQRLRALNFILEKELQ